MKTKFKRFISFIICLVLILIQLPFQSYAVEDIQNSSNMDISGEYIGGDTITYDEPIENSPVAPPTISTTIKANIVQPSEQISVSFDCNSIKEYTCHTNGLTLIQTEADTMDFLLIAQNEYSSMELMVTHEDGTTSFDKIYVYTRDGISFVSDLSMDEAFINGLQYYYEQGFITLEEKILNIPSTANSI